MSLQVWLPLNGNLNNQGLSDLVFTNTNTTNIIINNNGKIGKCYQRNTRETAGCITSDKTLTFDGDLSICCWAKVTETVGQTANGLVSMHSHADNTGFGINVYQANTSTYYISCSTGNGTNRTYYTYYGTTNIKDAWHHLALTYNSTTKIFQLWVDGQVEKTQSYNNSAKADYIQLFSWSTTLNDNRYKPACMLNDVRIYDHCLSDKEVQEIAKGLILHYKLDNIVNNNLLKLEYRDYNPANYGAYALALTELMELNQIYTIQLWDVDVSHSGKQNNELGLEVYLGGGNNLLIQFIGNQYFTNGHADYLCGTFSRTSWSVSSQAQNLWLNIYNSPPSASGTKSMHIGAWKLEKGSIPTAYNNNINNSIVQDSSGYGNDGTIKGTLISSFNTARYNYSTIFDGDTAAIQTPNLTTMITDQDYTISCWTYKTQIGTKNYQTIYGGPSGFELEARSGATTDPNFRIHNWGGAITPYEFNKWYHFCFVHSATDSKLYINGELKITGTSATIPSGNYFIGAWKNSTTQNYDGNISDFRIYATSLTEEQVKELYNTSASIDKQGNVYTRELVEA